MQGVLRQIVERLADGIVVVGADGCIRFANPAAESLFGRTAAELVGEEFGYPLSATEATEIEIVRRGGALVVAELRLVEAAWEDEAAILVSLRDVTDRKAAEESERQLERERAARAEAEAANQAKGEFLAVMSHELRTPLNAVLGYSELLDLGVAGQLTPEQRQQIGRITASARHLLGLVNEILDLAKVEDGRLTVARVPTGVAEVVETVAVMIQPLAEARGLSLEAPVDVPRALRFVGDRDRAQQVLVNLLSNAVKFTESGGQVRLTVESLSAHEPSRHLHGDGPWIALRVSDTGIGIAPGQCESIFSPFVQGEGGHTRRSDGSGLGLTISRRLARMMRGDVTVRSSPGAGSVFTLWLPATAEAAPGEEPAAERGTVQGASATRGLAEVGDVIMRELDSMLDAYVARLRLEPLMPAAATLRHSHLVDHVGCVLADVAAALVTLDESQGAPSTLLSDSSDIQRFVADRHGLQRARLGWSTAALAREQEVLQEVLEGVIRSCMNAPADAQVVEEGLGVIRRYLQQGGETSRRALERALAQQRDGALPDARRGDGEVR